MFANPVFITPGRLTAFLILRKKKISFLIFLIFLLNTVIKKIEACKTECEDRRVAG